MVKREKHQGKKLTELLKSLQGKIPKKLPFPAKLLQLDLKQTEDKRIIRQLAINTHYAGYLEREKKSIHRLQRLEEWVIPHDFDYNSITGLRTEARLKLTKVAPSSLAQAGRIDGVTPAEITLLQVHLKRRQG